MPLPWWCLSLPLPLGFFFHTSALRVATLLFDRVAVPGLSGPSSPSSCGRDSFSMTAPCHPDDSGWVPPAARVPLSGTDAPGSLQASSRLRAGPIEACLKNYGQRSPCGLARSTGRAFTHVFSSDGARLARTGRALVVSLRTPSGQFMCLETGVSLATVPGAFAALAPAEARAFAQMILRCCWRARVPVPAWLTAFSA